MAKQDNTRPDPREAELVETMTLDLMDWMTGKAAKQIVKKVRESTNQSATMAAITYKGVKSVATKNARGAIVEMDIDMLMGVATEGIDMLTEIVEASGQIQPGSNVDRLKEDTLLKLTVMHGETIEQSPENRQAAATDLRDYMSDGGTQKAFDYMNARAAEEGINPQDMMRAGNEAVFSSRKPLEDGIKKGLMTQAADSAGPPPPQAAPAAGPPAEQGLMDRQPPPDQPYPLPTGEGIAPNPNNPPPPQAPNAELAPPPPPPPPQAPRRY